MKSLTSHSRSLSARTSRCSKKSYVGTSGPNSHSFSREALLSDMFPPSHSRSFSGTTGPQPLLRHPGQVQRPLAGHPLGGVFVHVRLAVPGPLEEVGDHPEASLQQFEFPGVGTAEIALSLLPEDGGVGPGTGDLEAETLGLLQIVRADLGAAPEVDGGVLEVVGDGLVVAVLEEEAGLPVVAEPQPLGLALLPQHDG